MVAVSAAVETGSLSGLPPILSDWRNYEAWEADGKLSTEKRANNLWKQILEEFEPPMISSKISSELDDFVQRRIKEGGAKTDF